MTLDKRSKKLRTDIIDLSKANGGYHYGGSFSCVEILISIFDNQIDFKNSDRFILSKGHGCWGYYVLLRELGFDPLLEGHPHLDLNNNVHWTTGSEGHGLPAGFGMAFAKKIQNKDSNVYVLMGDGELQEGTTWETLLLAKKHQTSNLKVVVDFNKIQGSGFVDDILPVSSITNVAKEVGWSVSEVDGHNVNELNKVLSKKTEDPSIVIAHTIKGKGVSFMENEPAWHANWPAPEYEKKAREELKI